MMKVMRIGVFLLDIHYWIRCNLVLHQKEKNIGKNPKSESGFFSHLNTTKSAELGYAITFPMRSMFLLQ
uniref:Uncharacterized protein n=1 Tax=Rhizophora mucronata TaxID=61149 RepID=A0A2P2NYW8_RHIMU